MARIAFLGLGMIGRPMAERLLESGHDLTVWNRTVSKALPLVQKGARLAPSPRAAAEGAAIAVTMLTDGPAILDVLQRPDGLLAGLGPGQVLCDTSTVDLASSGQIAEICRAHSTGFVRAPVMGNRHAARAGKLLIFAGGPLDALALAEPALVSLGERIWRWNRVEPATAMKLALNLLLAGMMEILSESVVFSAAAGIDPRTLLDAIAASSLAAPMYSSKGRMILDGGTPNFTLQNMRKDLGLILSSARQLKTPLPATLAVEAAYSMAEPAKGDRDYSAIVQWLEEQTSTRVSGTGSSPAPPRTGEVPA